MNNINRIVLITLLIIALSSIVTAYAPEWKVDFDNSLAIYSDRFIAGVGSPATDGYNSIDSLRPPPPPSGEYILMFTLVDGNQLIEDYRADLEIGTPKTWEMVLVAFDTTWQGLNGTDALAWNYDVPDYIKLTLIDYGTDNTRTTPVKEIDIKSTNSYVFQVPTPVSGAYRYLDLKAELTKNIKYSGIPLNKGWNLISFPLNLTNKSIKHVFKNINFNSIFSYGSWHYYFNETNNNFNTIDESKGYWINSLNDQTLTIGGTEFTYPVIFNLTEGWNLISYPSLNESLINETLKDVNYSVVYSYNGSWVSYIPTKPFNSLKTLKPGYGYWVKK